MSCKHGNIDGDCDLCQAEDEAYLAGQNSGNESYALLLKKCSALERDLAAAQEANEQLSDALKAWEGEHCGGDCFAEPCANCDGTRHRPGKGENLAEQLEEAQEARQAAEALAESYKAELRKAGDALNELHCALLNRRRGAEMTPAEEDALVAQAMTPASTFGAVTTEQSIRLAIRAAVAQERELWLAKETATAIAQHLKPYTPISAENVAEMLADIHMGLADRAAAIRRGE